MLKRFAYHGITVSDLDKSIAFYRDLLHMRVTKTYDASGKAFEQATGSPGARARVAMLAYTDDYGDHDMKFVEYVSPRGKKVFEARLCDLGASHADISLDKIQQVYDELCTKGVRFIASPVRPLPQEPDRMFTYMLDPDGMVIELHRRFPHHAHVVSDLDRAVAFYRDILGMKLDCILDIKNPAIAEGTGLPDAYIRSGHMVIDTAEYVELHHYIHPVGKKSTDIRLCDVGSSHVAFDVDNVQRSYQDLKAKGVKFISAPVIEKVGDQETMMVFLLDQDGYLLELRSASPK